MEMMNDCYRMEATVHQADTTEDRIEERMGTFMCESSRDFRKHGMKRMNDPVMMAVGTSTEGWKVFFLIDTFFLILFLD